MEIRGSIQGPVKDKHMKGGKGDCTGQKTPVNGKHVTLPALGGGGGASCILWVPQDLVYLPSLHIPHSCLCVSVVAMQRGLVSSLSQEDPKASAVPVKDLCLPVSREAPGHNPSQGARTALPEKLRLGS